MLLNHFVLSFILIIFLSIFNSVKADVPKPDSGLKNPQNEAKITDTVLKITPHVNITMSDVSLNCIQMICKFVCFNGKSTEISKDIDAISRRNQHFCSRVDELRLYNYEFSENTLSHGFLGNYSDKVEILYLASANITDVEAGSFANGSFREIYFENLNLSELRKGFFRGIKNDFTTLSIIQKEQPLRVISSNFLCDVKYQIKYLRLQAGLSSIANLTGGDFLLNNLIYVDFSHNNFSDQMEYSAFSKVSMVEYLDLSHSNLEYLPSYIFSGFSSTLEYLNISFNKLKTISRTIFGWREVSRDLKIYANNNEWWCSCDLQLKMKDMFVYQRSALVCVEPEQYKGWSVFDGEICDLSSAENVGESITASTTRVTVASFVQATIAEAISAMTTRTVATSTTPRVDVEKPIYINRDQFVKLNCLLPIDNKTKPMPKTVKWSFKLYDVVSQGKVEVNILLHSSPKAMKNSFDLIWFSKVTTDYYKMEINYNEYGLGCYRNITNLTTIVHLIPNTAYTLCVVLKGQLPISPLSCRSLYVRGNIAFQYSAWLTKDQKITGLSLVIFGIIMFSFGGIILIYLLLKRKPMLLKGSKRVTTTNAQRNEIIVLPKENSMQRIKEKEEEILARRGPAPTSQKRRNSMESVTSYQSYINSNVYEFIPAYNNLGDQISLSVPSNLYMEQVFNASTIKRPYTESCCLTPLETVSSSTNLVKYAEIPYRSKRNDPLPDIPTGRVSFSVEATESTDKPKYAQVGIVYILDSQV